MLFRGLILRTLRPFGKRFAIVMSAVLFGMFHGNLLQAPCAMVIGLLFGYAAMEHSILWAVALHVFINQVAYSVGFNNSSHFTTVFKKYYGMTPTQYGEKHSEGIK